MQELMQFYKEFTQIVKSNWRADNQLSIIDILVDMHFINNNDFSKNQNKLLKLINKYQENFVFFSKSGEYTGESEDVIKNLFKVLCGIMNFRPLEEKQDMLSEKVL